MIDGFFILKATRVYRVNRITQEPCVELAVWKNWQLTYFEREIKKLKSG
jgi:hypothetical protein